LSFRRNSALIFFAPFFALLALPVSTPGQFVEEHSNANTTRAPLPPDRVIQKLVEMNSRRARALLAYEGTRKYRLQYDGFWGSRSAEMIVKLTYRSPGTKEFTIISQSGSRWIVDKIFKGLLRSEKEGAMPESARRMAVEPANYLFTFIEYDSDPGDPFYVFSIKPRSTYKYLYRGQIWVEAKDFAVARIKGEPARSPSFWMKNTTMEHIYSKIGGFWLPYHDHSVSQVRLGGYADLTIEYTDYKITGATSPEGQ
jgi:hypothetical protein